MIKNRKPNVDILLESTRQHLKGDNLFFYAVFYVFWFAIMSRKFFKYHTGMYLYIYIYTHQLKKK